LDQTKLGPSRSLVEEGTVFWLIVSAILLVYLTVAVAFFVSIFFFALTLALAVVEGVLASVCWILKKWGFLASTLSAIIISGLAFGILYYYLGQLLFLLQLMILLFSYRAYRETKN
jgi:hypothetical protein